MRARAIENHAYVVAAAQRGIAGGNVAMHGHSMIVDPWGAVLAELPDGDGVIVAEIDAAEVERRRGQIPVLAARRTDVYARPVRVYGMDEPAQTTERAPGGARGVGVVDQVERQREEAATAEGEGGGRLGGARGSRRVPGRGSEVVQLLPLLLALVTRQNDAGRLPSVTVRVFVDEPWTTVSFTVSPALWALMMPASWSMLRQLRAVDRRDDVAAGDVGLALQDLLVAAALDAGLGRGAARDHAGHEDALGRLEPERLGHVGGQRLALDAQPGVAHAAARAQLVHDVLGGVDGHGEAEAGVGSGRRGDLLVDADHLAAGCR